MNFRLLYLRVEFASKKRLYRRDFTINAIAIQLNQEYFGKILDFYGWNEGPGIKKIRILYSLSFTEDPTQLSGLLDLKRRQFFHRNILKSFWPNC